MIKVKNLEMWNMSPSMLFGKSPKISYTCGNCGGYNETRISMRAMNNKNPYVVCSCCGEINDTKLELS